jgi:hypothetical protein
MHFNFLKIDIKILLNYRFYVFFFEMNLKI